MSGEFISWREKEGGWFIRASEGARERRREDALSSLLAVAEEKELVSRASEQAEERREEEFVAFGQHFLRRR